MRPDERKLAGLREDKTKDGVCSIGNGDREWRVASSYLLGMDVLNIPVERQANANTKRLAEVMRTLGWSTGKTIRVATNPCRGYTKAIDEPNTVIEPEAIDEPKPAPTKLVLIRRPIRIAD